MPKTKPKLAIGDHHQPPADQVKPTLPASEGAGPLLQRDYLATIQGSSCSAADIIGHIRNDFASFSPDHLAAFSCSQPQPLCVGHELEIRIRMSGLCHVRIVHVDDQSFTMRTLDGHPEAGRITFGASPKDDGYMQFRIRSRARAGSHLQYIGYELFGKGMQTQVWTTFLERVTEHCGGTLVGEIEVEEQQVSATLADKGEVDTPTFKA